MLSFANPTCMQYFLLIISKHIRCQKLAKIQNITKLEVNLKETKLRGKGNKQDSACPTS